MLKMVEAWKTKREKRRSHRRRYTVAAVVAVLLAIGLYEYVLPLFATLCGVFAEFERGMIRSRVKAGQDRAKSQGKHIGRPTNLNDGLTHSIRYMRDQGVGIRKIATDLKVGVCTVYKVLEAA